eukprot:m.70513 g.70513  ORF g.70513 m.70513 type:complete len:529 (+) comp8312_c1_seq1:159-1745(+)
MEEIVDSSSVGDGQVDVDTEVNDIDGNALCERNDGDDGDDDDDSFCSFSESEEEDLTSIPEEAHVVLHVDKSFMSSVDTSLGVLNNSLISDDQQHIASLFMTKPIEIEDDIMFALNTTDYVHSSMDTMFDGHDDNYRIGVSTRTNSRPASAKHSRTHSRTQSVSSVPVLFSQNESTSSHSNNQHVQPQQQQKVIQTSFMAMKSSSPSKDEPSFASIHDNKRIFSSVRMVTSKIEYKPLSVAHWKSYKFDRQLGNVEHCIVDNEVPKLFIVLAGGYLVNLPSPFEETSSPGRHPEIDVFHGLRERMTHACGGDDQSLSFLVQVLVDKRKPMLPGVDVAVSREDMAQCRTKRSSEPVSGETTDQFEGDMSSRSFSQCFLVCTNLGNIALYDVAEKRPIWVFRTKRNLLCGYPIRHTLWRGYTRKRPIAAICSWDGTTIFVNQQGVPTFFRLEDEVCVFLCSRIGESDKLSLLYFTLNMEAILIKDAHYCTDTVDMDAVLEDLDRKLCDKGDDTPRSKRTLAHLLHNLLFE